MSPTETNTAVQPTVPEAVASQPVVGTVPEASDPASEAAKMQRIDAELGKKSVELVGLPDGSITTKAQHDEAIKDGPLEGVYKGGRR